MYLFNFFFWVIFLYWFFCEVIYICAFFFLNSFSNSRFYKRYISVYSLEPNSLETFVTHFRLLISILWDKNLVHLLSIYSANFWFARFIFFSIFIQIFLTHIVYTLIYTGFFDYFHDFDRAWAEGWVQLAFMLKMVMLKIMIFQNMTSLKAFNSS